MSLGRNILWNLAAFLWLSLLVILVTPFMVHRLGLDAFGVWSVLVASMGYLTTMDLGLGNALIRFMAAERERSDSGAVQAFLRSGLLLQSAIGLAAGSLFFLLAPRAVHAWVRVPPALEAEATAAFRVTALAVFIAFPAAVYAAVPAALRRFDLLAARTLLMYTAQYVLFVVVLRLGGGLYAVAVVNVVGALCVLVFLTVVSARLLPGTLILPGWHKGSVRELLRFGRFKFPAQISVSLLQQFDRLAIAAILPVGQVSFYAVPLRVSQRTSALVEQIASPFYPLVSSQLAGGRLEELGRQYRNGVRLIAGVAGGGLAVLGGLAFPLLEVWMGPGFGDHGAWPLRILLLAYAASALFTLPSVAADAAGHPGIPAIFLGIGSVLHVPLLLFLIPRYGLDGAALGVLGGFAVPLLLGVRTVHRRIPELPDLSSILSGIRGALVASAFTGAAALLAARSGYPARGVAPLLLSLGGAAALYAALLFLFGGIRTADFRTLAGLTHRSES